MEQVSIERGDLKEALAKWKPGTRHSGAYVVPKFSNSLQRERLQAHNFTLVPRVDDTRPRMEDGGTVTLPHDYDDLYCRYPENYPGTFTTRAMIARSITHLTLRMYALLKIQIQIQNNID